MTDEDLESAETITRLGGESIINKLEARIDDLELELRVMGTKLVDSEKQAEKRALYAGIQTGSVLEICSTSYYDFFSDQPGSPAGKCRVLGIGQRWVVLEDESQQLFYLFDFNDIRTVLCDNHLG
jgi:hypothetical protein